MGRIVVGVDASEESREALDWARHEAAADDVIVAVHAWDIPLVAGYEMAIAIDPTEIEVGARGFLDRIVTDTDDPRVVAHLAQGHPGRSLVEAAAGSGDAPGADAVESADMIVVGHRGSGKASMILGSTANYVMHHTDCPVVIIRGEYSGVPTHVVVGVDDHGIKIDDDHGENASVRALRFAYGLRNVSEIAVIHAWFAPGVAAGLYAGAGADIEKMDAEAVAVVEHVLACAGPPPGEVKVKAVPERGTAGFALVEASREADLVVVGSRGRGGFIGLLLGSTSLEVAAHSHAPVAIVR